MINQDIQLEFMNQDMLISYEENILSFGMNLYTSLLLEIYTYNSSELQGKTNFMSLSPTPPGYQPTDQERNIYYVVENSGGSIRLQEYAIKEQYINETTLDVDNNRSQSKLTIIISIASIMVVSIIVAPLLSKISQR